MKENHEMKDLCDMTRDELENEFDIYAAETGMDREPDFDLDRDFQSWLDENEIDLEDEYEL